jgi:hypothetical protein
MTLLELVRSVLDAAQIGHALIGAAALAASGVSRSTFDLDLMAADRRCLADDMWEPLRRRGATVDVRRGDASDPLAGVVRFEMAGERPVDLVVGRHPWQQRAIERALRTPAGLPVVQSWDLVLLKLYAGGTQDLWDIEQLLALPDAAEIARRVDRDLADLPAAAAARWRAFREGR